MSLFKMRWKKRHVSNLRKMFHREDFLRESDSSIERALFWSSNFLSVPSQKKSLLDIKACQEKCLQERINKKRITVNVSGERFIIPYKSIRCYPDTLLATNEIDRYFDRKRKEYFFDRDPDIFRYVFQFYKNDKIHFPMDECIQALIDEFRFFRIPLEIIKECCYPEFHMEYKNNANCVKCAKQKRQPKAPASADEGCKAKQSSLRARVRSLLKNPSSGSEARSVVVGLSLCVAINILGIILETLPCKSERCGVVYWKEFFAVDSICALILTLELLVTLGVTKSRIAFLCNLANFVFICSLVPAYVNWIIYFIAGFNEVPVYVDDALKAVRVFRLVKIAKGSSKLLETASQIVSAAKGLGLVISSCVIAVIVLSVAIYHLDRGFSNVAMAMWYFVVTMTSLGYGDCVPMSPIGKLLGSVGILLGILVVSLPVPIIQNKLGANIDEEDPEPDEIVLDNLYPPDFADRQRRFSRMFSLDHRVTVLNKSVEEQN